MYGHSKGLRIRERVVVRYNKILLCLVNKNGTLLAVSRQLCMATVKGWELGKRVVVQ